MKTWLTLVLLGVLLVIGGILAIANPLAASIAVTTLVGVFFLLGGVLQLWLLFKNGTGFDGALNWVIALITLVVGVWLLANPLEGTVSLAIVVGVGFVISGIARIIWASRAGRGTSAFVPLLLSGAASLLVGVVIFSDFQSLATQVLGLLLGIQLVMDGVGSAAIGLMLRNRQS
ncbi:acid-resistance membrane protein [Sulfitobacter sp. THAF37]|uniref:HdeD family acid-resistance protein n=1 Tax=Sulfitobacter sp. THAF37 TaxID=2587855 RepID=UPI001267F779|nr:DUF308 domain-containing protein [Sulfitobacter sp. THAF37]QFT58009.1 acid-resistance membrane protein [Sulfitobacter sp. THAF37]